MEDKINPSCKPDLTRLPMRALYEIAKVIQSGDEKYGRSDWRKLEKRTPEEINDHLRAALGHIAEFLDGVEIDESGHHKLAHAAGRLMILLDLNSLGDSIKLSKDGTH
jgi:hypothetical protein